MKPEQLPPEARREFYERRLLGIAAVAIYAKRKKGLLLHSQATIEGQLYSRAIGNPEAFLEALRALRPYTP